MFRGLKLLILTISVLLLANCGAVSDSPRTTVLVNDLGTTDSCSANSISQHFIIQHKDGRTEKFLAASKNNILKQFTKKQLSNIDFIENDFRVTASKTNQNTINANNQTVSASNSLLNWGLRATKVETAWRQNITGRGVTVAVIDSAVYYKHPQLEQQMLYNNSEIPGNGLDDDGNGLTDDYLGYDFLNNKGHDFATGEPASSVGDSTHGTHIAGILAAQHNSQDVSTTSIQGIAPGAKILPIKFLDNSGSGSISQALNAINYAVARGAKIINASWGGSHCSKTFKQAIANLESRNVIFVAATGNDGANLDINPKFPAYFNVNPIISVGAVGTNLSRASYSNFGQNVDILAPGTSVTSASSLGTQVLTGTSMAAPLVSGAIALIRQIQPNATVHEVRQALQRTTVLDIQSLLNNL